MWKQTSQHLGDRVRKFGIHYIIEELFEQETNLDSLGFFSVFSEQSSAP